ncbi:MAG TPA: hypothetical protein VNK95_22100 [Caldilineaceae bacterium]|nr:hypothetical protein [Caldilineaceae bacterium]
MLYEADLHGYGAFIGGLRFEQCLRRAALLDGWRRLRRQRMDLVKFDQVKQRTGARQSGIRRLEYVPLDQIVGSLGRAKDFTPEFLPRPWVSRERWTRVDQAYSKKVDLPPVELVRIGDVYFVVDGHHRISVARAHGYQGIEANVMVMSCAIALTPADFRNDDWLKKSAHLGPEEAEMELIELELAKRQHLERIREVEMERLARLATAGQPSLYQRFCGRLGNLLIALGQRLKANLPADAVSLGEA